jgi:hypothetical protein
MKKEKAGVSMPDKDIWLCLKKESENVHIGMCAVKCSRIIGCDKMLQKNNTWDSNVVPHRSTNQARRCLTSLSRREAVLSTWYGRS